MEQIFKKLPYDNLVGISAFQIFSLASAVSLALFLLAFFTTFSKAETKLENLSKSKYNAETTLERSLKIIASKEEVARKLNLLLGELAMHKKQLPSQNAINNIFEKVSQIGRKRNVTVASFKVAGGEVRDFYKEISLHFKFVGGFWEILDIFAVLKNMRQIVDISNFTFNAKGEEGASEVVSSITATIYVYNDVAIDIE
jgi:Tfp pilus assembly protein PilO